MKRAAAFLFVWAACACLPALAAAAAPTIGYGTPNPIRNKEATLRFTIDPQGLETTYEAEWARVGEELPRWNMPTGVASGEEPVAEELKIPRYWEGRLSPGQEYHWRIRAWNADGETIGPEQFFATTDGPDPGVANVSAVQTGEGAVQLTGTVAPEGLPLTDCEFRYLDEAGYYHGFDWHDATEEIRIGPTVPCGESLEEIGSGSEPVTVHAELTGLHPGEWHFRIEADNQYESSALLAGTSFTVTVPPPTSSSGPPITPGGEPPGVSKAPGLTTAPGLTLAPGLHKPRKKAHRGRRLRRNATISTRLRRQQRQR